MRHFVFIALIALAGLGVATPVFALTLAPARIEVNGDPGQTINGELELMNEQEGVRSFYSSTENFEPKGESGAPYFIGAKEGLATWIQIQPEVTLVQGEEMVIPFSISIPADAEPGGYFAAIFFGSQPPQTQGGSEVSIGGKIGALILLRVSGYIPEDGGLIEFGMEDAGKIITGTPAEFTYRIRNSGGDRIVPLGEITIRNTIRLTSAKLLANKGEGSVLPGSTRKFEVPWGTPLPDDSQTGAPIKRAFFEEVRAQMSDFHFGWYTASVDVAWGETNQTGSATYHFFIIPWQLLSIVFVALLIMGGVGTVGLKKYNAWIISQAMRQAK